MSISAMLLPEFDHEMALTRRVLERVPMDKLDWRPHDKSFTMESLAIHIARLALWTVFTFEKDELDLGSNDPRFKKPDIKTTDDLLAFFDANVKAGREALAGANDAIFQVPWSLKRNGQVLLTMPTAATYRNFVMNHQIHHRGQMTVYLRLNNIAVPGVYGPSADEQ